MQGRPGVHVPLEGVLLRLLDTSAQLSRSLT
jgi:hypothetical protein